MDQILNFHGGIALLVALLIILFVVTIHPFLDLVVAKLQPNAGRRVKVTLHLLLDIIICFTVCGSIFTNMHRSPWGWFWFGVSVTVGILVLVDCRKHLHWVENT